jgi:hypothetical protein
MPSVIVRYAKLKIVTEAPKAANDVSVEADGLIDVAAAARLLGLTKALIGPSTLLPRDVASHACWEGAEVQALRAARADRARATFVRPTRCRVAALRFRHRGAQLLPRTLADGIAVRMGDGHQSGAGANPHPLALTTMRRNSRGAEHGNCVFHPRCLLTWNEEARIQ